MRLLITGASGFLGSALLRQLNSNSFSEIHAVARHPHPHNDGIIWHEADLFHERAVTLLFDKVKPSHIIHGAWETAHGQFWTSEKNRDWLSASLRLLDAFERNDGKRFVFLGSMAEYDWTTMPLIEDATPEIPFTLYGETKLAFHRMLTQHTSAKKISAATGRLFNLYGPNEKPERLVPQLIASIAKSERIKVGSAERWRDLLHVDDAARAILALLNSEIEGAVNIARGTPTLMDELYQSLSKITGRGHLIGVGERPDTPGEPKKLYADAALIRSTGWRPIIPLEDGINELWAKAKLRHAA